MKLLYFFCLPFFCEKTFQLLLPQTFMCVSDRDEINTSIRVREAAKKVFFLVARPLRGGEGNAMATKRGGVRLWPLSRGRLNPLWQGHYKKRTFFIAASLREHVENSHFQLRVSLGGGIGVRLPKFCPWLFGTDTSRLRRKAAKKSSFVAVEKLNILCLKTTYRNINKNVLVYILCLVVGRKTQTLTDFLKYLP